MNHSHFEQFYPGPAALQADKFGSGALRFACFVEITQPASMKKAA